MPRFVATLEKVGGPVVINDNLMAPSQSKALKKAILLYGKAYYTVRPYREARTVTVEYASDAERSDDFCFADEIVRMARLEG